MRDRGEGGTGPHASEIYADDARRITVHEGVAVDPAIDGVARALAEAATWVGASAVRLDDVRPPGQARRLRSRLAERGVTATLGS